MSRSVYITGLSALTSVGLHIDSTWDALLQGKIGLAPIQEWQLDGWDSCLGGELKDFNPAKMLPDRKLMKVISLHDAIGITASVEAVRSAGLDAHAETLDDASREQWNEQTGVYVGSPGNKYFQQYDFLPLISKSQGQMPVFAADLFNEVHPMWLLRILPNNVLAYTGITYGYKGPNHNVTNHAVGGIQALIEAFHAVQNGEIERAVVVAYDQGIEPQSLYYYQKLGLISPDGLRPFDARHNGTVLANGAAALILESETSAKARGAHCYAQFVAGASSTEGQSLFSIDDNGQSLSHLCQDVLTEAELGAQDINAIVAHANGNPKSDNTEAQAITNLDLKAPCTGFKWSYGHTITASGLLDAVLAAKCLDKRTLPGIAVLEKPAESCASLELHKTKQMLPDSANMLLLNRGFASMDAAVILRAM